MNLFQEGLFKLHSEEESFFKIECDALIDSDWKTLAKMISYRCHFSNVIGIPRGGLRLAKECQKYISDGPTLIVDDVWTTGNSMKEYLKEGNIGYVIFAINKITLKNVKALFTLDG